MSDRTLAEYTAIIAARFPELATARYSLLTRGFHSIAVDVDNRLIFKFPRHDEAAAALRTEASLLAVIGPKVSLPVPALTLFEAPSLFSRHHKIPGEHLVARDYDALAESARQHLATEMARFYSELHAIDQQQLEIAGAKRLAPWLSSEQILREAWPVLPTELRAIAEKTLQDWQDLPPDPLGETYGFFDGHGWNMAFAHAEQKLNGIYDFADSGFGPLHQKFIYTSFISLDLTARVVSAYEKMTARTLDRQRIHLITVAYWISELGGFANDPEHLPVALANVIAWAGSTAAIAT